jgi:hypothetical protein
VSAEQCSWCGIGIDPDDGFRATEPVGERRPAFCRLEHLVPWALHGAFWDAGSVDFRDDEGLQQCAFCGAQVPDTRVILVRHRGEYRIPDAFCGVDHLQAWARAGGRWR